MKLSTRIIPLFFIALLISSISIAFIPLVKASGGTAYCQIGANSPFGCIVQIHDITKNTYSGIGSKVSLTYNHGDSVNFTAIPQGYATFTPTYSLTDGWDCISNPALNSPTYLNSNPQTFVLGDGTFNITANFGSGETFYGSTSAYVSANSPSGTYCSITEYSPPNQGINIAGSNVTLTPVLITDNIVYICFIPLGCSFVHWIVDNGTIFNYPILTCSGNVPINVTAYVTVTTGYLQVTSISDSGSVIAPNDVNYFSLGTSVNFVFASLQDYVLQNFYVNGTATQWFGSETSGSYVINQLTGNTTISISSLYIPPISPTPTPSLEYTLSLIGLNETSLALIIYAISIIGVCIGFFYMRNNNVPWAFAIGLVLATIICNVIDLLGVYTYPIDILTAFIIIGITFMSRSY